MNFAAFIGDTIYDDPALFEVDALVWRKAKRAGPRITHGAGSGKWTESWADVTVRTSPRPRPWKAPRLTEAGKPFEPGTYEVGSWLTISMGGFSCTAQVWSDAPRGVWAVDDTGKAYWVDPKTGTCSTDPPPPWPTRDRRWRRRGRRSHGAG